MKIYTRGGDTGETSLVHGTRLSKAHIRIEAYGTVDELNSILGTLRDMEAYASRNEELIQIQSHLFDVGSHLACEPDKDRGILPPLTEEMVQSLEKFIDRMEENLPPMTHFILPGGHPAVSQGHVARTVARRAERRVVALAAEEPQEELILRFLNRLSDYFFVLTRAIAQENQTDEIPWVPQKA